MKKVIISLGITLYFLSLVTRAYAYVPMVPYLYQAYDIRSSLMAYWTFNGKDTRNGVASDISGNSFTGNLMNIATSSFYLMGKVGQGFNFDGVDDAVQISSSAAVKGGDFTVALWERSTNGTRNVYYTEASSVSGTPFMIFEERGGACLPGQLQFTSRDDAGNFTQNCGVTTGLTDGKWHHVVLTVSGTSPNKVQKFYFDGAIDNTISSVTFGATTVNSVVIGALQNGSAVYQLPFQGSMDEVRTYTRALSAQEVFNLYLFGTQKFTSGKKWILKNI